MAPLLHCDQVGKTYRSLLRLGDIARLRFERRRVEALAGVSFRLERGALLGLMGANGSGKSTLLRVAAGLLLPSEGALRIEGREPYREQGGARRRVGVVLGGGRGFFWRLSARENLRFFAELAGVAGATRAARVDELLARVGLEEDAARPVMEYSTGMRQRLAVARALIHQPALLLLDEVTQGLDPDFTRFLLELLDQLRRDEGVTVIHATHHPDELEGRGARVLALEKGAVRFEGTLEGWRARGACS